MLLLTFPVLELLPLMLFLPVPNFLSSAGLQLQDLRAKYGMLQEDLDTSMAESEGYAEQLALAQHQIRQYEAQIQQYDMDLDSAAGDLELMHGRAREAEKQVWGGQIQVL